MTYSNQGPLTYGPIQNGAYSNDIGYSNYAQSSSAAVPAALGGIVVGGSVGAYMGNKQNPFFAKSGEITDSFTKSAYENYVNKAADKGKEAYKGGLEVLKKIDTVKTPEELKTLLNNNKEATAEILSETKQSPEEFLNRVTKENLEANKKTIKEKINTGNKTRYQDMKNQILACWDKDKKKFVKNENVTEEAYNAIKKSTSGMKTKIIAKYLAIGAAITGIVGFIVGKFLIK